MIGVQSGVALQGVCIDGRLRGNGGTLHTGRSEGSQLRAPWSGGWTTGGIPSPRMSAKYYAITES